MKLNTYYSSSEFQGLSGTQVSREGYVPKAEVADEGKFLKADGTWSDDKSFAIAMAVALG